MFRVSSLVLASLFLFITEPAPAQSNARAFDPVGTYDLDLERDGHITGTVLTITRDKEGKLSGSIELHEQPMAFQVTVEDRTITLQSVEMALTFTITVKPDASLSGSWSGAMGTGGVQGVRRKS